MHDVLALNSGVSASPEPNVQRKAVSPAPTPGPTTLPPAETLGSAGHAVMTAMLLRLHPYTIPLSLVHLPTASNDGTLLEHSLSYRVSVALNMEQTKSRQPKLILRTHLSQVTSAFALKDLVDDFM